MYITVYIYIERETIYDISHDSRVDLREAISRSFFPLSVRWMGNIMTRPAKKRMRRALGTVQLHAGTMVPAFLGLLMAHKYLEYL